MNLPESEHQQGVTLQLATIFTLTTFVVVSLMPAQALAVEAALPSAHSQALVAPVQLAGRDPYLAQAINNLPDYSYREAGSVTSTATPITDRADWPEIEPVPTGGPGMVLEGEASFYSRAGCLGCNELRIMANGEPLDDAALTMAIGANYKHLVGYHARVTSLATGKSVTVKITDTGGFYQAKYGHRVADLTIATKQAIGMIGGVGQVRVEIL